MGRIRTIKPEFFLHEGLYDLEAETGWPVRVAFAGLWCQADREGRFKWKPRRLKPMILPHDPVEFEAVLCALAEAGFVQCYTDGEQLYGVIVNFLDHQSVNTREAESKLPDPAGCRIISDLTRADDARARTRGKEGKGKEGKGRSTHASRTRGRDEPSPEFLDWWESWRTHQAHGPGSGPGSRKEAWAEWKKLSLGREDLHRLTSATANYLADCLATQAKTRHACRFLKNWEEWEKRPPRAPAQAKPQVSPARQQFERAQRLKIQEHERGEHEGRPVARCPGCETDAAERSNRADEPGPGLLPPGTAR